MEMVMSYKPVQKIRIVTAASLFDGHDAAINIMRRLLQATGAEVIHLGHNRSVEEIVSTAIQEDVQAIAITSYQGGHMEFFRYMYDLLHERGCGHIKIFGGGGGTILPKEIRELQEYGISRIYSPDDGRKMGLQGMINDLMIQADYPTGISLNGERAYLQQKKPEYLARMISAIENDWEGVDHLMEHLPSVEKSIPVLGITGTGGAGKSSLVDELVRRFTMDFEDKHVAIISVDPSKRKTGGALLGDRIRMNSIFHPHVYMRSLATRKTHAALSQAIPDILKVLRAAEFDLIILETSGIGQSGTEVIDFSDVSLYVMTPEFGAATQLEKIDMLDFADLVAVNKFDKQGAEDALRDVRKQYRRNHGFWNADLEQMPVYATIASQFNDPGMNRLYRTTMDTIVAQTQAPLSSDMHFSNQPSTKIHVIPPSRVRYLSEIAETIREYDRNASKQAELADQLYSIQNSLKLLEDGPAPARSALEKLKEQLLQQLDPEHLEALEKWPETLKRYTENEYVYEVRGKEIRVPTYVETLSHNRIPKIALPKYRSWGDILKWLLQENVPGAFPYTSGVYPFKRKGEDPTRMFAGEGAPERTNRRFHYLSEGMPAKRLSTAFDSVTLYGEDPCHRPDIYGKIGNSGVSVCSLDDAKKLYAGFDLCDPSTSVSMTINGPAATVLAFFLNTAIDQQCEKYIREQGKVDEVNTYRQRLFEEKNLPVPSYHGDLPSGNNGLGLLLLGITGDQIVDRAVYEKIKAHTLNTVRGTVQADILKEDQAQNTCIFSTEFSLRLQGDVQQYFIDHKVRNFYSVSISGYHIAEAGANPITQLAFTLANGFTFLEYYLARGMDVNDFTPNFSFFFSNGVDPEYAVIGRVARRIWSKALRYKYGANERAQKLKYHIQTSGRSLHAQEISFNDIRTTLQALYAIYDNCNSLHTNAYDEAITTPTEESVRRAIAIQLIINRELGMAKNENPLQGAFIIEELTDLVDEAVLTEFERITSRGGVLGAMETMYQRTQIQEESIYYESLKHSGEYPIVGVNSYLSKEGSPTIIPGEVIRASEAEKLRQIENLGKLQQMYADQAPLQLEALQQAAVRNENTFERLMEAAKCCSLGQITRSLFEVGGQYRRNM